MVNYGIIDNITNFYVNRLFRKQRKDNKMEDDNWNTVSVQNAEQEDQIEIEFEEEPEKNLR